MKNLFLTLLLCGLALMTFGQKTKSKKTAAMKLKLP
jgi:hypothetical protein